MTTSLDDIGKRHLWLSFGRAPSYFDQPTGIIVSRTKGCYVYDTAGRAYLDAMGGQGAAALGYNHPRILEAMRRQMELQVGHVSGFAPSDTAIKLAEKLAQVLPEGVNRIFFCHSGSEANDTAIKLVRQYHKLRGQTGRFKVVSRWGGYHGCTLAATAATGFPQRRQAFEPLPDGFVLTPPPYCYRCPYGKGGNGEDLCDICNGNDLRTTIEREGPSTIAAVLMELTMGVGGTISPPVAYVETVRALCDEYDLLLIVDEVATGFGKTGTWFEVEHYGIVPDLMTLGKAITGGHAALSAVCVQEKIAQRFSEAGQVFEHGFTSAGNPLACAAAIATIEVMQESRVVEGIPRKHDYLVAQLREIGARSSVVGDIRGRGVMMAVELVRDVRTRARFADPVSVHRLVKEVQHECGVLFGGPGMTTNMNMMLPLVISDSQIDQICQAIKRVARVVEESLASH